VDERRSDPEALRQVIIEPPAGSSAGGFLVEGRMSVATQTLPRPGRRWRALAASPQFASLVILLIVLVGFAIARPVPVGEVLDILPVLAAAVPGAFQGEELATRAS
jgi:hypothetical protein